MRAGFIATIGLLGGSLLYVAGASAAPMYIGISEDGGSITTLVNGANGTATVSNTSVDGLLVNMTAQGTPPLPEPELYSTTLDLAGSVAETHTYSLYVTELNQFPLAFSEFQSNFTGGFAYTGGGALPPGFNSIQSFTASTYVTECAPINSACSASTAFSTANLLSVATFTQGGATSFVGYAANPLTTSAYAVTEVYTFTVGAGYGEIQASTMEQVPEPASLTLLGVGLAGIGFLRRRRRA